MVNRRVLLLSAIFLLSLAIVVGQLARLTLVQAPALAARAEAQRVRTLDYYQYARGDIRDRQGRPLVNIEQLCLVVLPAMAAGSRELISRELAAVLNCEAAQVAERLEQGERQSLAPYVLKSGLSSAQAQAISAAGLPGVFPLTLAARYSGDQLAPHLLGYVQPVGAGGAYQGVSGLEQQYERILAGRRDVQVLAEVDAAGSLSGDGLFRITPQQIEANYLQLTLDRDYQQLAEQAFRELGYAGALVVMDPDSGDIRALVSAPGFDPNLWQTPEGDAYLNKALCLYPPASTFKTLLALAALSEGTPLPVAGKQEDAATDGLGTEGDSQHSNGTAEAITATEAEPESEPESETEAESGPFVCSGSYTLENGHSVHCGSGSGHGQVDLASALALSCNCYFVALGQELGGANIRAYAERLGLTELEISGFQTPDYSQEDFLSFSAAVPGDVANVSLGEAGTAVSVVQEAVLTAACVNGGFRVYPRLVTGAYNAAGAELESFPIRQPQQVVATEIAQELRLMLAQTVEGGTAAAAQGEYWRTGGKTGSSESGGVWFSGFAPVEQPALVVSVYVENGSAGGIEAAAVFKQVIDSIALLDGRV